MLAEVAKPDVGACPSESYLPQAIRAVPRGGDGNEGVVTWMLPPPGPGQVRPHEKGSLS